MVGIELRRWWSSSKSPSAIGVHLQFSCYALIHCFKIVYPTQPKDDMDKPLLFNTLLMSLGRSTEHQELRARNRVHHRQGRSTSGR
jgi:hypothetical protein